MIGIIDYDAGNLKSEEKALIARGEEVCVTRDRPELTSAATVLLPGCGNIGAAVESR